MVFKYVYGRPIQTGAVTKEIETSKAKMFVMQFLEKEDELEFSCEMKERDDVYGLGEQVRGMNKRGFSYISYAADDPVHTENKHSLYGGHNFVAAVWPGKVHFPDVLNTKAREWFVGKYKYLLEQGIDGFQRFWK